MYERTYICDSRVVFVTENIFFYFLSNLYLEQSCVGVASVTSWKEIFKVLLTQDKLHSSNIVWIGRSLWRYFLYCIIVKSLYSGKNITINRTL